MQSRIEIGAVRPNLGCIEYLGLDAFAIEYCFQESRAEYLVAGRIGGVDAQVVGEDCLRLAGERIPFGGSGLSVEHRWYEHQREDAVESVH